MLESKGRREGGAEKRRKQERGIKDKQPKQTLQLKGVPLPSLASLFSSGHIVSLRLFGGTNRFFLINMPSYYSKPFFMQHQLFFKGLHSTG